jgi:hypothetical protein
VGLPGELHQAVGGPQGLQEVLGAQGAGEGAGDGKERGPRLLPPLQVQRGQQPRRQPLGAGGLLGVQPGFGGQLLRRKAALVQDADGLPEGDGDRVPYSELRIGRFPHTHTHRLSNLLEGKNL